MRGRRYGGPSVKWTGALTTERENESNRLARKRGGLPGGVRRSLKFPAVGEARTPIMIHRLATDEDGAIAPFEHILNAFVAGRRPTTVFIVRIRDWFSSRWFHFSGKRSGLVRVSSRVFIIPPFVPNRVAIETRLNWNDEVTGYVVDLSATSLHKKHPSRENLQRTLARVSPSCVALWLGGDAERDGRMSAMLYAVGSPGGQGWYLSVQRKDGAWTPTSGVGPSAVDARLVGWGG